MSNFRWVAAGLFLTTLATLLLEISNSRLLSVLTWYHLSFLAVSMAMLGMAAGGVLVFVGGDRFRGDAAIRALPRYAFWFALAIAGSHILNLCIPIPPIDTFNDPMLILALMVATTVLTVPFVLSGIVVTVALTRTGGSIGGLYAADLVGASAGALLVIPLLSLTDISSVVFVAALVATIGAVCFGRIAGRRSWPGLVLAGVFGAVAIANTMTGPALTIIYPKNRGHWLLHNNVDYSAWNTHSFVTVGGNTTGPAFLWGPGEGAQKFQTEASWIVIDGEAGTPITKWNGNEDELEWTQYDVTAVPYQLRSGSVGVIGVGGGRDVLSALSLKNRPITGIEINQILLDLQTGPYRYYANIADHPSVELVHDEARSYLSRTQHHFDVLQMSLIDTWASTGAGAFTLTENGLYTREGWRVFLGSLRAGGIFSVSRWFSPEVTSETNRLVALGVAALLDQGVTNPANHLIMVTRGPVATMMVSTLPFTAEDQKSLVAVADRFQFSILVAPWKKDSPERLQAMTGSRSEAELAEAASDETLDFSPPTDERPFFFNVLKPRAALEMTSLPRGGAIWGNVRATVTLLALFAITLFLVVAIIGWPLVQAGLPPMELRSFALAIVYFASIGAGFMLIQIALLQRFSVYLGHPTYTFAVLLFTMIFFTGAGSWISDRFSLPRHRWMLWVPLAIVGALILLRMLLQPVIEATTHLSLPSRSAVVILFTAPLSVLLGFCFPIGMRLVGSLSDHVTAWMWGVNGAAGVLASVVAVSISLWVGIQANILVAAALYLLLLWPAHALARRAFPAHASPKRESVPQQRATEGVIT